MHLTVPILLAALPLAFFAGALAFRNNPLKGAKTLYELEVLYAQAKAKLKDKLA